MVTSEKFEEEYARLNQRQKEAVDSIEGPVMVIAGPGTGKTTILTLRIANILKQTDTPPSGILALTFTEAGVKAMKSKLRDVIGKTALEVPIHTFHGFAASVIAEFSEHFPHLSRSKQITDVESENILREILKQKKFWKLRPLGEPDFYLGKILGTLSDCKQEAWTPEMLRSFAKEEIERVKTDESSISTRGATKGSLKAEALKRIEKCERTLLFADVYEEYENKKKEERKIDFDDLLFELLKALREDKLLLQLLQEKFLYILVDEHQDTNDAQNLIVRLLANFFESPNLFVVGDEKQAIYRFQGASVENFLKFQREWSNMKLISLEENYRSSQHFLDASHKMIEENYAGEELQNLRVKLKSKREGANPIKLVSAPNTETEEAFLISKMRELTKKDRDKSVAIIVRKNSDVSRLLSLFEENDIKASAERGANIFSHPVGTMFFSLLEFLYDPSKTEAIAETLAGGLWGLPFQESADLIKKVRSGSLIEVEKRLPEILNLRSELSKTGPLEFLSLAADISGISLIAGKNPLSAEVWRAIFELAKDLAQAEGLDDPRILIESLLNYKKTAERKVLKIKSGEALAQITIMTAHSAKGLEFDFVFLPFATEESWMTKNRGSYFVLPREKGSEDDLKDERRLFYVSLTRARNDLTVSFARENGSGSLLSPLRFIEELDEKSIDKIDLEAEKRQTIVRSLDKEKQKEGREKLEYAKIILLENGLSVTALNHFLTCPSEFFYKSILKLPEPPSASSEKGNAMHEAISNVWKNHSPTPTSLRSAPPQRVGGEGKNKDSSFPPSPSQGEGPSEARGGEVEKIIIDSVTQYFRRSLLGQTEKEVILEELLVNAPKVAVALKDHFNKSGKVLTESWVDTFFKWKFGDEKIEIKLHGKMDAIVENETLVEVFDYKTKEGMTVNEIKGETKNSTGDYFRQLIFYKLLLSENSSFKNKKIEPSLVFVKPDSKGRCPIISLPIEDADVERVRNEISSLLDSVWSGSLLTAHCPEKDCKYCNLKIVY